MTSRVNVRFTEGEFKKVLDIKVGEVFSHVNLFHSDPHLHLEKSVTYFGVKILKGGSINGKIVIDPELDLNNSIKLDLLSIEGPICVRDVPIPSNIILHNEIGLLESLYDRYSKVLSISIEDIKEMDCYMRKFKVLSSN